MSRSPEHFTGSSAWLAAFAMLALACGARPLSITLLQPASVSPDAGDLSALTFSLSATWDGGASAAAGLTLSQGFSLAVETSVPLDLQIDGRGEGLPAWRGEWHGTLPRQSAPRLGVLMLPVGFVSSFPSLSGVPPLAGSSATPLDLGRVLIVGGIVNGGIQQAAWIYDQAAVAFGSAALPARPRAHHLALPLGEGQVLLAGGDAEETSIELYSPEDGGVLLGALFQPERLSTGAWLDGGAGAVLGCGREPDGGLAAGLVIERWPDGGLLPIACSGGRLVQGEAGPLVISAQGIVQSIASDGSRTALGRQATPRSCFGAADDGQGGVLLAGGFDGGGVATQLVEDIRNSSVAVGRLDTPRADLEVLPFDGGYLAIGGVDNAGQALASAQILRGDLTSGGELTLSHPRRFPAAVKIPGYNLILILSGQGTTGEPSGGLDLFAVP
jgi:hypothetical protein